MYHALGQSKVWKASWLEVSVQGFIHRSEWEEDVEMWVSSLLLLSPLEETLTICAIVAEFPRNIHLKLF